ncbi:MAG TPA: hypothetical protein VKU82_09460 [Planctomycetaceae bacterium]|nr:hypothetical protein [Planctomycetaceae bacterium]
MSTQDDFQETPKKSGMSSSSKAVIILGSIAGVVLLLCCGGGIWGYFQVRDWVQGMAKTFSNDPAIVRQRAEEIIHIDVPEDFAPVMTMEIPLGTIGSKMVIYQRKGSENSVLTIVESKQPMPPGQNGQQHRDAMLRGMRQGQQFGNRSMQIDEQASESRNFTIGGEKVPFEFIKGTANGVPSRQVFGAFPGKEGTVMLMLMVQENEYDEPSIVKMLESIRLPGDKARVNSESASQPEAAGAAKADAGQPAEEEPTEEQTPESSP